MLFGVLQWSYHLSGAQQIVALADAALDVQPLLLTDGGVGCRAGVGQQQPEDVPQDPKDT